MALNQHQPLPTAKPPSSNLWKRIGIDAMAATTASALISPFILTIDRSIVENTSGRSSLLRSVSHSVKRILSRPHAFIFSLPFALVFSIYSGTYMTANTIDTIDNVRYKNPVYKAETTGFVKFSSVTAANSGLSILKDSFFTKFWGTGSPRPLGWQSYGLYGLRDALTIAFSFNIPPMIAPFLPGGLVTAQLATPCIVQFVSTPLHLMALDIYNRGGPNITVANRMVQIRKNLLKSTFARVIRILPAFGIGGVTNRKLRTSYLDALQQRTYKSQQFAVA
ncbi:hypothetical protein SPOG_00068 [Schizosaccharomyces cryophilus OY26]|uniref:Uncharacterized protein n=1 Tax=Schizosaccharomyces cryophilus (strain OY26 / ATCC MYA-4695 / CBS 11777 / NBRC 106824 / NRRL Y48691) TaxID=653667 RepID=S9VV24_SCHCR|nr:uncharacterized protein SPOG_00068 [Schizosaccharomyces cryophilus OY26]EPY51643.1 hypothetical protein SPOG_00068 [Schizosaccharomyces cryophilus OY26]